MVCSTATAAGRWTGRRHSDSAGCYDARRSWRWWRSPSAVCSAGGVRRCARPRCAFGGSSTTGEGACALSSMSVPEWMLVLVHSPSGSCVMPCTVHPSTALNRAPAASRCTFVGVLQLWSWGVGLVAPVPWLPRSLLGFHLRLCVMLNSPYPLGRVRPSEYGELSAIHKLSDPRHDASEQPVRGRGCPSGSSAGHGQTSAPTIAAHRTARQTCS